VILARKLRWHALEDGALLDAAEREHFDVLLTCDQNFAHQQNLRGRKLAIVIISTNSWPKMKPLAARVASAVAFAQKGQITRIDLTDL
jgi:hypothetical protein